MTNWTEQIEIAEKVAREAHKGQVRTRGEDKGKPYIIHPERIADKAKTPLLKCVGWLHDVIEDCNLTQEDLKNKGVCEEVLDILEYVTKKNGENYYDFIMRITLVKDAMEFKLLDIEDNMLSLEECSLKDKYRLAKWILEDFLKRWISEDARRFL